MKFLLLIFKNVRRNMLRTSLTSLGTIALVLVVTLVWSILQFLADQTNPKKQNIKAIITEKWQLPSQMPLAYSASLRDGAAKEEADVHPIDSMTWQFFGGSMDPARRDPKLRMFAFALQPEKLLTMMDGLDALQGEERRQLEEAVEKMKRNRATIIMGEDILKQIDRRVGDKIMLYGVNYSGINLEFEIVGSFTTARYAKSSAIDCEYLNAALDVYPSTHGGEKHPLADKTLNLVWLKVENSEAYAKVAEQIETSSDYRSPPVKCEVSSNAIAAFLEGFRDIFWGMRWILGPSALISLSLIIANAISISVRERRMELAVMKVLGFRPYQIVILVVGESLLLGVGSGLLSSGGTYCVVNLIFGGIDFPIAFFPKFDIPLAAWWWGPAVGGAAAILGSISPAWQACRVKVSEVFAKVA
ncbi:MAG: ABC transporter permease [Pirellulaceae bacterium]|nr:ABC transporter permease [Pirellulaceae bacterium]